MANRYRRVLVAFMSYRDDAEYDRDYEFTQAELAQVTADDVARYMNQKVYGTPTPMENDRPTLGRSNTLYDIKKALSFFMPNKLMTWDVIECRGNPTRSAAVNDLIKRVKKFEARRQGAPSKARRALKEHEFRHVMSSLYQTDHTDIVVKYGIPALLAFQFHMIGRLDDSSKWLRTNLQMHDSYPGKAAKAKLCWGKNVHEERDAPWQHMFGCMDTVFCVLINIGLWLEIFHATVPDGRFRPFMFAFLDFPCTNPQEPTGEEMDDWAGKIKSKVYRELHRVMKNLTVAVEDLIGTHSIRKMASTWVRGNGVAKDDKDHRGRWAQKRISDIYDDVEFDYVDTKVAAVLC